jgi:hypothetical protein
MLHSGKECVYKWEAEFKGDALVNMVKEIPWQISILAVVWLLLAILN